MKIRLVKKLLLLALFMVIAGVWNESKAQIVLFPKKDKYHNTGVLFPRTNRTSPVIATNGNHLPPGQAKKIYGEKSAKRFAPGQRKKAYNNNWQYSTNKYGKKIYKNPKKHDD